MKPRVSVPKIFLRGSRLYVRVQVPTYMRSRLCKREYWVSLATENRSDALQKATKATQDKRIDMARAYAGLEGIRKTVTELSNEQKVALARECYRLGRKIVYRGTDLNAWAEAKRLVRRLWWQDRAVLQGIGLGEFGRDPNDQPQGNGSSLD